MQTSGRRDAPICTDLHVAIRWHLPCKSSLRASSVIYPHDLPLLCRMDRADTLPGGIEPMSRYAWIVTRDHLDKTDVHVVGPRTAQINTVDELKRDYPVLRSFRMYDDDGELYYSGTIGVREADDNGEILFAPLEDYGMPNAGAVRIDYRNPVTGEWETL